MRPRQWVKSSFVFTGILFANAWRQPLLAQQVLLAAAAFSLTASGVYIINDLLDRATDLQHPKKKLRPLASRTLSNASAVSLLAVLWIVALVLALFVSAKVLTIIPSTR